MRKLNKLELSFLIGFVTICMSMFCTAYVLRSQEEPLNEKTRESLNKLETFQQAENWPAVISVGEALLMKADNALTEQQTFDVINQLISTYFFLGEFEKANYHATALLNLANNSQHPERVATSLYKFSAVLRAQADQADASLHQQRLFKEARDYAQAALQLCHTKCLNHKALKAKILFNAAAAEADDPYGNLSQAVAMYQEALTLFKIVQEESYYQRTLMRLAKVYLLQGNVDQSWHIIEQLKQLPLATRSLMHLCYLEAQVLQAKHLEQEALQVAKHGQQLAETLHAKADLKRFDTLTSLLTQSI